MQTWKVVTTAAASGFSIIVVLVLLLRLCRPSKQQHHLRADGHSPTAGVRENGRHGRQLYSELQKVGSDKIREQHGRRPTINFRKATPTPHFQSTKFFDWTDHPHLMIDAVENGWSAFALYFVRPQAASPSISSKIILRTSCNQCAGRSEADVEPEISWEIGNGADHMQSIRLNPGRKFSEEKSPSFQVLLSALPLPGPPLGRYSYPHQAYFEVIIQSEARQHDRYIAVPSDLPSEHHCRKCRLISSATDAQLSVAAASRRSSACPMACGSPGSTDNLENDEYGINGKDEHQKLQLLISRKGQDLETHLVQIGSESRHESHILAIGLSASEFLATAPPGSHLGSIGYYSDGHILLDAKPYDQQHNCPSPKVRAWGGGGLGTITVGCGFNPKEQRVFFTLNGEIVSEVRSMNPDFKHPLHACIGSNYDAAVVVNFGQSSFLYVRANEDRAPDPGNNRPPNYHPARSSKGNHLFYEDSAELFSMGRLDSQKLLELQEQQPSPLSQELQQHRHLYSEVESDLFEIALEGGRGNHSGKSTRET